MKKIQINGVDLLPFERACLVHALSDYIERCKGDLERSRARRAPQPTIDLYSERLAATRCLFVGVAS